MNIILACNLQLMSNPRSWRSFDYGMLGPPDNEIHACERMNLFWTAFIYDRCCAISGAIPGTLPVSASGVSYFLVTLPKIALTHACGY